MATFRVLQPGLFTTIQDLGRYGYESQGVPTSGAMDEFAFRVGNILLGNEENAPALEITIIGPTLEVLEDTVVAVTGADLNVEVNGKRRTVWSSFPVRRGDILSLGPVSSGCRAYLAVCGGFSADTVMGSASTYTRGKLGGLEGRPLKRGDVLSRARGGLINKFYRVADKYIPSYGAEAEIRVIPGPQDDCFDREAFELFLNSTYTVTKDSDRMGYRLEGPEIRAKLKHDIITDGILPGAVQVPGNGKPIVMLKDAQTTGGYTKIATCIWVDLSKLAQLKPGDRLQFKAVDLKQAHEALRERERLIKEIKASLKTIKYFDVKVSGRTYDVIMEDLE
ncbi:biotin-dependent carboxyltransferase family protein [Thermosediminibacter oceani]|uniref:Urea amidolyase related protein n=1 Tax=Thermosediminibacter oceani (strain ATCC BAA-1034 / DSM 16646 / JW/IW-1228P) TaxID=555079 RepID=D9RZ16_THEOJ|nr:biotin-dependent carboxyltransferase family protein [Thermosediminibacter oceani]ADL08570.1 urea amidolyase related protein [Thermosediminibacter oceani DSM 16646]